MISARDSSGSIDTQTTNSMATARRVLGRDLKRFSPVGLNSENKRSSTTGSLEDSDNSKQSVMNWLTVVQKVIMYVLLFLLPLVVFPLPWNTYLYGKAVLLIVITILLLTIELVKIVQKGKLSVLKSQKDLFGLLVLATFVLSTAFSMDWRVSLLGINENWATGLIGIFSVVLFSYVMRTIVKDKKTWIKLFIAFLTGISMSAVLSVLAFFGKDVLKNIPVLGSKYTSGITTYGSLEVMLTFWGIGLLISMLLTVYKGEKGKKKYLSVGIPSFIINMVAILVLTIGQLQYIGILAVVMMIITLGVLLLTKSIQNTTIYLNFFLVVLFTVAFILFRLKGVQEWVLQYTTSDLVYRSISFTECWRISISTLAESVRSGLLGFGNDMFVVAYNRFKMSVIGQVDIKNYGTNEVLTIISNRGFLGIVAWLTGIFFVIKSFIQLKSLKDITFENRSLTVLMAMLFLFVYVASFFTHYAFMLYFMLYMAISMSVLFDSYTKPSESEFLVLKFDLVEEKLSSINHLATSTVISVLVVVLGVTGLFFVGRNLLSYSYIVTAENKALDARVKLSNDNLTLEERRKVLGEIIQYYDKGMALLPNNYTLHRRQALMLVEYIGIRMSEYNKVPEGELNEKDVRKELGNLGDKAVAEVEKSTEIAPLLFDNWRTQVYVLMRLSNLGFNELSEKAMSSIVNELALNPKNSSSYYSAAQLYGKDQKYSEAIAAVQSAISLNPGYIEAYILGAQIYSANGDTENAMIYWQDALSVLREMDQKESELYKSIEQEVTKLKGDADGGDQGKTDGSSETVGKDVGKAGGESGGFSEPSINGVQ